ncbi:MAG: RluA family pseudouridine synthase [Treponema sp.]|jgi:23S rRNA pseudouridine955/2504/2580 synthase|nr:RluA family pseudouridine synthase [Treponema sp.]
MATNLRAEADDDGRRLDRILRKALPDLPLSALHRLLRQGRIRVNGAPAKAEDRVPAGAAITLPRFSGAAPKAAAPPRLPGAARALPPILFEGAGLLVLNKPPGLAVHGPESLETLVRAYLAPRLPPSLSFRPGPLHRLDKPTSGVIVFSTGLEGARRFSALLREGRVKKRYLALAEGLLDGPETWRDELLRESAARKTRPAPASAPEARTALTRVTPLARAAGQTLLLAEIATGRTHQIRAQAAIHRHPLSGDRKYGAAPLPGGFLLHAWELGLDEDALPGFPPLITAPPPEPFDRRMTALFGAGWLAGLRVSLINHPYFARLTLSTIAYTLLSRI